MKRIIYPAVLYIDNPEPGYIIALHDLGLVTEGASPEEAFAQMKDYLEGYYQCALDIETDPSIASSYAAVAKARQSKKSEIVLMVDVKVDESNKKIK